MLNAAMSKDWLARHQATIALGCLALLGLALFARLMAFPLRHDEQFYLTAGYLADQAHLYKEVHFTHLPNFPLLLNAVFNLLGIEHLLLAGRMVMAIFWGLSAVALYATARFAGGSRVFGAFVVSLLLLDPLLLRTAGMLVTNNFAPTPFALLGLYFLLSASATPVPRPMFAFAAGVFLSLAIGFKANYVILVPPVAVAAILFPSGIGLRERLLKVTAPLVAGALVAGLPTIYFFLEDPGNFIAHVVNFHGDAHVDYWTANPEGEEAVVLGFRDKFILAQGIWLSGTTLLTLMLAAILAFAVIFRTGEERQDRIGESRPLWPLVLLAVLVAEGMLISFVPTPAFPQYYAPPIALGLMFCALAHGYLSAAAKAALQPVLAGMLLIASFSSLPILLPELRHLAKPSDWTGNTVHEAAGNISQEIAQSRAPGKLLTLAPAYAAEAGLKTYDALLLGPFIYRSVDYVDAEDRGYFSSVASPRTLDAMLEADPPAAVLVGTEDVLDDRLEAWARNSGYRPVEVALGDKRRETGTLYLRAGPLAASP